MERMIAKEVISLDIFIDCASFPFTHLRDNAFGIETTFDTTAGPRDGRNVRSLCQDIGRDLVSEGSHDRCGGTNELNALLLEGRGKTGVLGSMTPTRPYTVHLRNTRKREAKEEGEEVVGNLLENIRVICGVCCVILYNLYISVMFDVCTFCDTAMSTMRSTLA